MTKVIEVKNIRKYYLKASEYSLDHISLTINKGISSTLLLSGSSFI